MGILKDLVTKLLDFQLTTNSEPAAENFQEGSDLFLEVNQSSTVEASKEQVKKNQLLQLILFHGGFFFKLLPRISNLMLIYDTLSLFRSLSLHLAPSSSISVSNSGIWLLSWLLCLLTH